MTMKYARMLCAVAALFVSVTHADSLDRQLRAQGLVPSASPPTGCTLPAFAVRGTPAKPEFVKTDTEKGASALALQGKHFRYSCENRGEWGGSFKVWDSKGGARELLESNVLHLAPVGRGLYDDALQMVEAGG